jgi:hypothetical protein
MLLRTNAFLILLPLYYSFVIVRKKKIKINSPQNYLKRFKKINQFKKMVCSPNQKKLCGNCELCINRSFFIIENSKYLVDITINSLYIFKGSNQYHIFKCNKCFHHFTKRIKNVTNGQWCGYCSKSPKNLCGNCEICFEKSIASENFLMDRWNYDLNGDSKPRFIFKGSRKKYWFDCEKCNNSIYIHMNGYHTNNQWCRYCTFYINEEECRKIIEKLTGKKFPTKRPSFLNGMEYDGYSEELKLAFEYQGIQHYEYIPKFFHKKGYHTFMSQLLRDEIKKRISKQLNIKLIIIPYNLVDSDKLKEQFIKEQLNELL